MRIINKNKKALYNYEILEKFEAGISLLGSEVKSIRAGRISLKESYADIKNGEVFLVNCHISPYEAANRLNHQPLRERKLLLHKHEIKRLVGKIKERGYTLIATTVLINDKKKIKIEIALAKGKKVHEKRNIIRERDLEREMQREMKNY